MDSQEKNLQSVITPGKTEQLLFPRMDIGTGMTGHITTIRPFDYIKLMAFNAVMDAPIFFACKCKGLKMPP
jgi:hypothetical protein